MIVVKIILIIVFLLVVQFFAFAPFAFMDKISDDTFNKSAYVALGTLFILLCVVVIGGIILL